MNAQQDKDAEIERLKELVESWKGGHSIAVMDRDLAKDRVKYLEGALQRQDNAIIEKDAEIERLKALCARAADALASCNPEWPKFHAGLIDELRKVSL